MNPLRLLWSTEVSAFHLRMGGCKGCAETVDRLLRGERHRSLAIVDCGSPRHAGLMIVTGLWTPELGEDATRTISKAPRPNILAVVGDCALGRGIVADALREHESVLEHLRPDVEISGCPATPEQIAEGLARVTDTD